MADGAHVGAMVSIADTFGAGLIGAFVTCMLYGLTTVQTYFYFINYPKDGHATRLLVWAIWILDTLHVAFMCYCIYFYLATNYGNPSVLGTGHWSLYLSTLLNVIIAFLTQCFFTQRIYELSPPHLKWWITGSIGLFVVGHLCFGVETIIFFFIKKQFSRLHEITNVAAMPFAIFAVLSDITIAGALCILLHGNRTQFKKTNALLNTLIIYAINRCLLTSVVAIVEVIVFCISPNSLWFIAIDFVIGKLYANSLLATLNTRRAIQNSTSAINSVPLSDFQIEGGDTMISGTTGVDSEDLRSRHVINFSRSIPDNKATSSRSSGGLHDDSSYRDILPKV
ncbi:hypothetical protein BDN72DRAFT_905413 [Pluteus cervinus]|uniref:Uncharacterized protein n=1 Tax=Pluteus cervinus TaxID=181527 RepID=A0ACD3A2M8_9AGAR|nr:hypothetical protein BDN72DRAFT_905413 [Pluteus cervinus]